ncbi:MAG: hypothetical protein EUB_03433 [Eubacterium sp.]|uniref:phage tail assembly chaperone n=1 Tax=Eubacterium sp. TaxID=142586 RepID=UPI003051C5DB
MNEVEVKQEMDKDEILKNESTLMDALLDAADFAVDEDSWRMIEVPNRKPFSFTVHPLSEDDIEQCRKDATLMIRNPQGKHLPKIEGTTDYVKLRSLKIYRATIREDQEKLWNNPDLQAQLKVKLGLVVVKPTDVIDAVLKAGQKSQICDIIDEISGFDSGDEVRAEDYAKN